MTCSATDTYQVRIHVSFQDTSGYIRIRILITNVPKLDNKCSRSRAAGGTRPEIEKLPDHPHVHFGPRTERNENGGFANCSGRSIKLLLVRCHI
jgi:hypothetical protein